MYVHIMSIAVKVTASLQNTSDSFHGMLADNHVESIVHDHQQQNGFLETSCGANWDAIYIHLANVV